jgi:hypothetical protein
MTAQQARVHAFMVQYQQRYGRPPSFVEIGRHMRFKSPLNAVSCHLEFLLQKGAVIALKQGKYRKFVAVPVPSLQEQAHASTA